MAKIALVGNAQYREGINEIGDIIAVLEDDQTGGSKCVLIKDEAELYTTTFDQFVQPVLQVPETTVIVKALQPQDTILYKAKTTDWSEEVPEEKPAWIDSDGNRKEIIADPKYKLRYENGLIKENYSRSGLNDKIVITKDGKVLA